MRTCVCFLLLSSVLPAAEPDAAGAAFFEKKIRPVLIDKCYACHSVDAQKNKKLKGGLLLDSKAGLLKGGDSGTALVPGKPEQSLLLKGLKYGDELRMPPKGQLPATVIADFETWIRMGAPDPRGTTTVETKTINIDEGRKFWAFQPPRKSDPPKVLNAGWPRNDLDRFILAKLEEKGLAPNLPAAPRALIRRLHFDLVGLPPSPEEVETFVRSAKPRAALGERVDQLLQSPHHGERWARYWLDVARFAEDQAHTFGVKPFTQAFRYRDWVVQAFNNDMPFDLFARLQIAGDLMPDAGNDPANKLAGLGFLGLGHSYYKNTAAAQAIADELDDRIDTLTRGFLGLTASCARCHDHKFDPIPQKDYYSLAGIYNGSDLKPALLASSAEVSRFNEAEKKVKSKEGDIQKALGEMAKKQGRKAIPKDQESKLLSDAEKKHLAALRAELETLRKTMPTKPSEVHVIAGGGKTMRVYIRGNPAQPGEEAPKGFLQVLPVKAAAGKEFGRLELAGAIASRDNPLTARVIVNRVWQHHFGRGLVGTPSNFGQLGERPTHPELLDWLAVRFMEEGWSLKWLHRTIVLSATYQLSCAESVKNAEIDGDNRFLWRASRRRLDVESWRDSLLTVSGKLDRTLGGPSQDASSKSNNRRTVYARISRHRLDATLNLFDFPDPNVTSATRPVTTIPQQQLFALNSDFMIEQAKAFAQRIQTLAKGDRERIMAAFGLAFGRAPTADETQLGLAFLALPAEKNDRLSLWEQYAQALLGTNEFTYVD